MGTYDVKLIEQPTGAVHNVVGHGVQPILDETTGEPETQFALVAEVDGHYVNLGTFTKGYVDHCVGRPDTAIDDGDGSSSSSTAATDQAPAAATDQPAAPAEGAGTAGEGAAQQPTS